MERNGIPAGQGDEHAISPSLSEAVVISLHQEFPEWAVWLPRRDHPWIAVRMASRRAPSPGLPAIWVRALTALELADQMRRADAELCRER
jgi:hypothetical protein